jgi:hypothetical protein
MLLRAEAHETVIRKYNDSCLDGPWSARCINSFWAYAQPIREMHLGSNLNVTLSRNLYNWGAWGDGFITLAQLVMNSPEVGGRLNHRPYDWFTLRKSENPVTIDRYWQNIRTYGVGIEQNHLVYGCYDCSSDALQSTVAPNSLFVVLTGAQYVDLSNAP